MNVENPDAVRSALGYEADLTERPDHEPEEVAAAGLVPGGEPPILDVLAVTKTYGEGHTAVTAVEDATMHVREGEFVALLGPSGSGKTTLLSMIGGLLKPTSGSITIGGIDVAGLSKKELTRFRAERVGFVFQAANLVPFLTARENLLYVSTLRRGTDRRAAARGRTSCWRSSGCRLGPATSRRSCPAASASASPSVAR